ncbi:MAG TPA: hypothetical protein VMW08_13630 [Acidimicrobiales bacterium]|nr:hypothetical protein [Acidimicrobiales bacterium]
MGAASNPDDPDDAAAMRRHAAALADAMVAVIPGWVEAMVLARSAESGVDRSLAAEEATAASTAAIADGEPRLRELLAADVDAQTSTPLAIVRSLVRYPNESLDRLGVAPNPRADFDRRAFPDDTHGLSPAAFADVHPDLHELGITWGAAKAHIHLRRHKPQV